MATTSSSKGATIERLGPAEDLLWGHAVVVQSPTQGHAHYMHELVIGLGSGGSQNIQGTPFPFVPGGLYFLPEGVPHNVTGSAQAPARFCYVCFPRDHFSRHGQAALQAVVDAWAQQGQHVPNLPFELRLELNELAQRLIHELHQVHGLGQAMAGALLTEIVVKAHRQVTSAPRRPSDSTAESLEAICDAISQDPEQEVALPAMARRAGMSRSAFARAFRLHTGMTLLDYTLATRVQAARQLLETSELAIGEVAGRVGFRNLGHFHAVFKRQMRMTPLQYRRLSVAQGASRLGALRRQP